MFNPDEFLATSIPDTVRTPVPVGAYTAQIDSIKPSSGTISKGDRAGEQWARLDIVWSIEDAGVKEIMRRSKVTVTQGLMLDLTPSGDFDTTRNERLNKFRKTLGLAAGASVMSLIGQFGKVSVEHEIYNGEPQEKVKSIAGMNS